MTRVLAIDADYGWLGPRAIRRVSERTTTVAAKEKRMIKFPRIALAGVVLILKAIFALATTRARRDG